MLSNNGLCLRAVSQYVLLFLAQFNSSDQFQITELHTLTLVTRSYVLCPCCYTDLLIQRSQEEKEEVEEEVEEEEEVGGPSFAAT